MPEYIKREAVERAIDSVYSDLYPEYVPNSIAVFRECLIVDVGIIPNADVQPVDRWISVKDRLPEKFDYVLCYCKTTTGEGNEFMFGAYHNDTWWLKTCRTYATLEQPQMQVMYWMPLPKPPETTKG